MGTKDISSGPEGKRKKLEAAKIIIKTPKSLANLNISINKKTRKRHRPKTNMQKKHWANLV